MLIGLLFDDRGNRMTPTWAAKGGRRWRYYVSHALMQGRKQDAGSVARVPAEAIEQSVRDAVRAAMQQAASASAGRGAQAWNDVRPTVETIDLRAIPILIERVTLNPQTIEIAISEKGLAEGVAQIITVPWSRPSPFRYREVLGATPDGQRLRPMRDDARKKLVAALVHARRWLDELMTDPAATTDTIAVREGQAERSIRRTLSLAFLAPDIVKAAVEGRLARGLNLTRLLDLPPSWSDQRSAIGL